MKGKKFSVINLHMFKYADFTVHTLQIMHVHIPLSLSRALALSFVFFKCKVYICVEHAANFSVPMINPYVSSVLHSYALSDTCARLRTCLGRG